MSFFSQNLGHTKMKCSNFSTMASRFGLMYLRLAGSCSGRKCREKRYGFNYIFNLNAFIDVFSYNEELCNVRTPQGWMESLSYRMETWSAHVHRWICCEWTDSGSQISMVTYWHPMCSYRTTKELQEVEYPSCVYSGWIHCVGYFFMGHIELNYFVKKRETDATCRFLARKGGRDWFSIWYFLNIILNILFDTIFNC
jgi:hypothetical protein